MKSLHSHLDPHVIDSGLPLSPAGVGVFNPALGDARLSAEEVEVEAVNKGKTF